MFLSRRTFLMQFFTLVFSYSLTISAFGANNIRPKPPILRPARIVLDHSELFISANQSIAVKARILDRRGTELLNEPIKWTVLLPGDAILTVQPIDRLGTNVLITAKNAASSPRTIMIRAKSGNADAVLILHVQDSMPAEIIFPDGNVVKLKPKGRPIVRAYVLNADRNIVRDAEVTWEVADPELESFVDVGANTNNGGVNSTQITWLAGAPDIDPPSEIKLVARSGKAAASLKIEYQTPKPDEVTIEVNPAKLSLQPGNVETVEIEVRSKKDKTLLPLKPGVELADPTAQAFIKLSLDENTLTVIAVPGTAQKPAPAFIDTQIIVRASNAIKLIPISFRREATTVTWDILPPSIVGDNYGRTIKNDYYCIEISIQNNSGSDLALAQLNFFKDVDTGRIDYNADGTPKKNPDGSNATIYKREFRPNTTYSTVHGSLEKRKLTHPRTLTLSIIDAMGSLLTGFNPFFRNINHAKNYSQFIDILSNPLAKGLASAWKDPYPDEMRRFEEDVLKDGQTVANNAILKTKIFVPKKSLFGNSSDAKRKRNDLEEVKKELGSLMVLGFRFEKGPIQPIFQGN
jgi:hypothetical protein